MTDLIALKRMNDIMEAINKMHNGLLALIDEHHKLTDRVQALEDKIATQQSNAEARPS